MRRIADSASSRFLAPVDAVCYEWRVVGSPMVGAIIDHSTLGLRAYSILGMVVNLFTANRSNEVSRATGAPRARPLEMKLRTIGVFRVRPRRTTSDHEARHPHFGPRLEHAGARRGGGRCL